MPKLICCFEDDGAAYLITEYVPGIELGELSPEQQSLARPEVRKHLSTLRSLRSRAVGGPSGLFVLPYRGMIKLLHDQYTFLESETEVYVFNHGDFNQGNILVDPDTLKITAIIDWEYAGFWPEYFEGVFFERPGPSVAMSDEEDDTERLLAFIRGVPDLAVSTPPEQDIAGSSGVDSSDATNENREDSVDAE